MQLSVKHLLTAMAVLLSAPVAQAATAGNFYYFRGQPHYMLLPATLH